MLISAEEGQSQTSWLQCCCRDVDPLPAKGWPAGRSEALERPTRHHRRVPPTRLHVPPVPLEVPPLALPRRLSAAVGRLKLAGLHHAEAPIRQGTECIHQVAGLGHSVHCGKGTAVRLFRTVASRAVNETLVGWLMAPVHLGAEHSQDVTR